MLARRAALATLAALAIPSAALAQDPDSPAGPPDAVPGAAVENAEPSRPMAPPALDEPEDAPEVDVAGPYRSFRGGVIIADRSDDPDPARRTRLVMGGYLRVLYRTVQDDPALEFTGRNDGFLLANARPYLSGVHASGFGFRFQLELAGALAAANDVQPQRPQVARPRDLFISYEPHPLVNLQAGQFKPPFTIEELLPNADLLFIDRSVGSDGVRDFGAFNVPGLAVERQIGLSASGSWRPGGLGGFGAAYSSAVTNGSPAADTFNDNDQLAAYGRASIAFRRAIEIGAAAFYSAETVPNQQDTDTRTVTGWTADLIARAYNITALAAFTERTEETDFGVDQADEFFTTSRAFVAQLGYRIEALALTPAYRYAWFDPTAVYTARSDEARAIREEDTLVHHTLGLRWAPRDTPISLFVNATLATESDARRLDDDRLEALVQLNF